MNASTKTLLALRAVDLMSRELVLIPREMSLEGAARLLARAGVTGAPVVNEDGQCIGVLSTTDFMNSVDRRGRAPYSTAAADCMCSAWQIPDVATPSPCRVENFMTKDPVFVNANAMIGELAHLMMDAHIHRVIVVDGPGQKPIGIVSSMDVLAAVARASTELGEPTPFQQPAMAGEFS
ncbi:MAG: CBS domain-containing protein [Planctomycetes bacterium]|nr:CBS domain-containing protein [Planctomycetota bacterium]